VRKRKEGRIEGRNIGGKRKKEDGGEIISKSKMRRR